MRSSPCKRDCPNRHYKCHAECPDYKECHEQREEYLQAKHKEAELHYAWSGHIARTLSRVDQHKYRKRKRK